MPEPEDVQFECHACHKDCKGDAEGVMTECRLGGRQLCSDCVDEYGRCVECSTKKPAE
jgi:hypothetical protein